MRVPLVGGAYQARSLIANAQRCVNLFPEINPPVGQAPVPATHYQTAGLLAIGTPPNAGAGRGLYLPGPQLSLLAACGNKVYLVDYSSRPAIFSELGTLGTNTGPVSMIDNGASVMIVDGSSNGYTYDLNSATWAQISDPAFYGSNRVDYCDTFFCLAQPSSRTFYISLSNSTSFDALDFASRTGYSDVIQAVVALRREIWLIGALTTEVWVDTGAADFPFQPAPGAFIEQGTIAIGSVARIALESSAAVFWLSLNRDGQKVIMMGQNYQAKRVSTHAIENTLGGYGQVSDAEAFTFQEGGHAFYQINFPTADASWVYDLTTDQWHQRAWSDENGQLRRHRAAYSAATFGFVQDWEDGTIYLQSKTYTTDDGDPIQRIRGFPHMVNDGKRIGYRQFIADMQVGSITGGSSATPPEVSLAYSDDRGATFGNPIVQSIGDTGEFLTSVQFQRLGMARDRVFELSWSVDAQIALNGAWVDYTVFAT